MALRIRNQEGYQNCMIGSKVTTVLTTFCPYDFFGSRTSLLWIMGESAGEALWLLVLVTCDM